MDQIRLSDVLSSSADIESLQTKFLTSIVLDRIVKFVLFREDESEFFDLTPYIREYKEKMDPVIDHICSEIEKLNYKTELGYGKTAIFIYKSDVPENCW